MSKCAFGQPQVEYLGHVIDKHGVAADPTKIDHMLHWPRPQSLKALRGFLGLTGYYRRFIQGYGKVCQPLTLLLKKDAFKWNSEAELAFTQLKSAMTSAPVLALPDYTKLFVLECDASGKGIGAVLMQEGKPVAYYSKAISPTRLGLSTYEKELLAVVMAVTKWRHYLLGRHFQIRTDHQSLKFLLEQRVTTLMQQKWISKLMGFDFEITYKSGKSNAAADALSRVVDDLNSVPTSQGNLSAMVLVLCNWVGALQDSWRQDAELQQIIQNLQQDPVSHPHFVWQHDMLYYKSRLVVGNNDQFRLKLLHEHHASPTGGHSGGERTYHRLKQAFYWRGMKQAVLKYVAECDTCQRNKSETVATPGLLQPLPIPNRLWSDISMDFIEGLPSSSQKSVIFVVVDRLSKCAHFIALTHPYTATTVAQAFLDNIFKLHGMPSSIVSDRDPIFTSNFWQELFRLQGTTLCMSTSYHPQTDGQTEVVNRCLENYLRCLSSDRPTTWIKWLPMAEWWYNTTYHISTGITPYEALYGQKPPSLLHYAPGGTTVAAAEQLLQDREVILKLLKEHLATSQHRMKQIADPT